ncbi:TatD family hydrolase [Patescibacteria group bacterium]|nr:TatD family hydrolase [Patescibacteria group bacterium]
MLIDSHAHLNFKDFNNDLEEVIGRCRAENIEVINVGAGINTSERAVEIAEKYNMYAGIGVHPIHTESEFDIEKLRELARSDKVVAIGEIGLDYFKDYGKYKDKQKEIFIKQLDLAKELDLPIIIHCRMAHRDVLDILKDYNLKGVIHCFTGNWEEAKRYLDLGFYVGMNGIMFKFDLKEVIEKTPLDKILLETDCPYLIPPQVPQKRNEPIFMKYTAEEIAKIKNITFREVAQTTVQNTKTLFKI